jgi:hypothetical protein
MRENFTFGLVSPQGRTKKRITLDGKTTGGWHFYFWHRAFGPLSRALLTAVGTVNIQSDKAKGINMYQYNINILIRIQSQGLTKERNATINQTTILHITSS